MDANAIPDDVFIEIFSRLSSPADISSAMLVCRRFHGLGRKQLMRELLWIKDDAALANLESWRHIVDEARSREGTEAHQEGNLLLLPRKVTVGVRFDFGAGFYGTEMTPQKSLYDAIYTQLILFPSLHTLCLRSTTISLHTYFVLRDLPTLRSLSIVNCMYICLAGSFATHNAVIEELLTSLPSMSRDEARQWIPASILSSPTPTVPPALIQRWTGSTSRWAAHMPIPHFFNFSELPITHLTIQTVHNGITDNRPVFHPIGLLLANGLEKAELLWTTSIADAWRFVWDASGGRERGGAGMLQSIKELDVTIPMLSRDIVDSFVSFVGSCTRVVRGKEQRPRIRLVIERHNFSDVHILGVELPISGVGSYMGPLVIARTFLDVDLDQIDADGCATSEDKRLRNLVMTEPLELNIVLRNLARLPNSVHSVELRVRTWDVELLFAVRELFKNIREVVVRYGRGTFGDDFLVLLGANILFDLPNLVTLRLIRDPSCILTETNQRGQSNAHTYALAQQHQHLHQQNVTYYNHPNGSNHTGSHFAPAQAHSQGWHSSHLSTLDSDMDIDDDEGGISDVDGDGNTNTTTRSGSSALDKIDIRDYLVGWNRYCKKLRCLQLSKGKLWERKFEGDQWRENGTS